MDQQRPRLERVSGVFLFVGLFFLLLPFFLGQAHISPQKGVDQSVDRFALTLGVSLYGCFAALGDGYRDAIIDVLTATRIANRKDGGIQIYVGPPQDLPVDDWEEFVLERGEQDIVEQLSELIKLLNKEGAVEALKRVRELTEIQRYSLASVKLPPNPFPSLRSSYRDRKWEDVEWQEDAPPTAAEPNPGSDQTDAGK